MAAGCLLRLVALLSHASAGVVEKAVMALRHLAYGSRARRNAIAAAGAVPPLVALLTHVTKAATERAAETLRHIVTRHEGDCHAAVAAGCAPPLVALLSHASAGIVLQAVGVCDALAAGSSARSSWRRGRAGRWWRFYQTDQGASRCRRSQCSTV